MMDLKQVLFDRPNAIMHYTDAALPLRYRYQATLCRLRIPAKGMRIVDGVHDGREYCRTCAVIKNVPRGGR